MKTPTTICGDPRHDDVTFMISGHTETRQFKDWSMAFRDLDLSSDPADTYRDFFTRPSRTDAKVGEAGESPDRPTIAHRLLRSFRATLVHP